MRLQRKKKETSASRSRPVYQLLMSYFRFALSRDSPSFNHPSPSAYYIPPAFALCVTFEMNIFLKSICKAMERVAPLRLAEKWDNVRLECIYDSI